MQIVWKRTKDSTKARLPRELNNSTLLGRIPFAVGNYGKNKSSNKLWCVDGTYYLLIVGLYNTQLALISFTKDDWRKGGCNAADNLCVSLAKTTNEVNKLLYCTSHQWVSMFENCLKLAGTNILDTEVKYKQS